MTNRRQKKMKGKKTLLVADDDRTLHDFYREIFAEEFEILNAYDGAEALMMAVAYRPDVMILDVSMPLLDGRSLCSKLKKFPATQDVKIVMVTGKTSQYDRLVGLEVGADDYLEKPAYRQQLSRSVRSLVGHS